MPEIAKGIHVNPLKAKYFGGMSIRKIARITGLHYQTIFDYMSYDKDQFWNMRLKHIKILEEKLNIDILAWLDY